MLPIRAKAAHLADVLAQDSALRLRLVTLAIVVVLAMAVVVSDGVSVSFQVGGAGSGGELAAAGPGGPQAQDVAAAPGVPAPGATTATGVPAASATGTIAGGPGGAGGQAPSASPAGGGGATGQPSAGPPAPGLPTGEGQPGEVASPPGDGAPPPADGIPAPQGQTLPDDPCAGAVLGDTDQGVSADTVKVAVLQVELAALEALGFGLDTGSVDYPKILTAWTNEINATGGIGCRPLTLLHDVADLSEDSLIAACKRLTQDEKVFGVLAPGGLVVGAECIARDNRTPLVTLLGGPDRWHREGAPFMWDLLMSQERILRNHVRWLVETGQIVPGDPNLPGVTRVGIMYADEPYSGPSVESAMLDEFARWDVIPVRVARLSPDLEQASVQIAQVVLDFQVQNIDFVTMPTNLIAKSQFMQQAEQQNYFPTYSDSDVTVGCLDLVTVAYPSRSWDGTQCLTEFLINGMTAPQLDDYLAGHPYAQYADAVYLATNPEGYDDEGRADEDDRVAQRATHYLIGSLLLLLDQAADRVGPQLTREAWGVEMGNTGVFERVASPMPVTFGPEKWSGADHLAVVQWHAEAGDGYDARSYRAAAPPFPAWY